MEKNRGILYTGERMIPGETPDVFFFEHLQRYYFIKDLCKNKAVLDVGCGNGYGAMFLANYAKEIVGVDIDDEAIKNARRSYIKNNLRFFLTEASGSKLRNKKFGVICSFEVIEHIKNQKKFLLDAKKLLGKNGVFVISAPNKLIVSPNSKKPSNPFHIKEFDYTQFKNFLEKYFKNVEIYGQITKSKLNNLVYIIRYIRNNKYFFYASIAMLNLIKLIFKNTNMWKYQKNFNKSVKILEKNKGKYVITKKNVENSSNFIAICKNVF
jgi:ubiquinone/menaquinone biosynthesis C-methylase UbiE|tara:strand:+ start:353 stop:1153 length:801 start_codon:yes stop_codon:yes gene_type:complete